MPSEHGPADARDWRRLHPLSPIVGALETLAGYVIPLTVVLVFSRGSRFELLIILSLIPSVVFQVVRYFAFHYRFTESEIIVRSGVVRRTTRHVPYERIQNIDLSRNVLQRAFGLNQLSLETASGKEPEAVFRWVTGTEAREIRARVQAARLTAQPADRVDVGAHVRGNPAGKEIPAGGETLPGGEALPPALPGGVDPLAAARPLHRVPLSDLALLGAFSPRGAAVFAAVFGFGWQLGVYETPEFERWIRSVPDWWGALVGHAAGIAVMTGLAAVVLTSLVSIVISVAENFGFELADVGTELRTKGGLLTQHASTIPKGRIQILHLVAPLHLRPFGRVRLRAGTAGGRAQQTVGRSWILPIVPREKLTKLLESIQPTAVLPDAEWMGVDPNTGRRMKRRLVLWTFFLAAALFWKLGLWALLLLLVLPFGIVYADRTARHLGYAVTSEAVFARHGWLYGRTQIVRLSKIQTASVVESPFDRKWKMASLVVETASPTGGSLEVPYLPADVAQELQRHLSREASRRQFHW
ncbi:MAG: PH domain-containing protein [Candidatus Eisenbacteria bacterium]